MTVNYAKELMCYYISGILQFVDYQYLTLHKIWRLLSTDYHVSVKNYGYD